MGITKDVVVDYGLDNTGVTPITTTMFGTIRTEMTGQDFVNLTFPAGTYKSAGFGGPAWVPDCGDLTLECAGATFTDNADGASVLAASIALAQIGIDATVRTPSGYSVAGGKSARIQTCHPGATSVTLTTTGLPSGGGSAGAGHISRFSIGQWIMVAGWATQGEFQNAYSFPPNFQFFDFAKITNISGDTVTFANDPLTFYYDENWPEINRGSEFEVDAAGPATIFALSLDWDGVTTLNDGTLSISTAGSTYVNNYRRETIINNFPQTGKSFYPSITKLFRCVNSPATTVSVEHDKLIDLVDISGGAYGTQWHVQSSSTKMLRMDGISLGTNFNGTGRICEISNSTVAGNIQLGPTSYGRGETAAFTNCVLNGGISGIQLIQGTRNLNQGFQDAFRMSGGVLTVPMNVGIEPLAHLSPTSDGKSLAMWTGDNGPVASFQLLSATADRWPAVDDASATIGISFTSGTKTLTTDTPLFTVGDVNKTVFLPGVINNFSFGNCTITNASPGVVTFTGHNKVLNEPVRFQAGSGVLPSPLVADTNYYVLSPAANTFQISAAPGGAAINTSGGSGTVRANHVGNTYSHITGYVNSTTVTVFDTLSALGDFSSVSRDLRYGTCNAYITTNWAGEIPPVSQISPINGKLRLTIPHGYSATFTNCTGTNRAVDLSQTGAQGKPLDSYTKREFNGQTDFTTTRYTESIGCLGRVTSIKVNVITPYTGAGTLTMQPILRGWVGDVYTGSSSFYTPTINLKIAGERVFTPGNAATGAQTGDTLTALSSSLFNHGTYYPQQSRDITGESSATRPTYTIEIITDQGFSTAPTAVMPLRFRLRG